jgi:hypothetical protein
MEQPVVSDLRVVSVLFIILFADQLATFRRFWRFRVAKIDPVRSINHRSMEKSRTESAAAIKGCTAFVSVIHRAGRVSSSLLSQ